MCQVCDLGDKLDNSLMMSIEEIQAFSALMISVHRLDIFDFELNDEDLPAIY